MRTEPDTAESIFCVTLVWSTSMFLLISVSMLVSSLSWRWPEICDDGAVMALFAARGGDGCPEYNFARYRRLFW